MDPGVRCPPRLSPSRQGRSFLQPGKRPAFEGIVLYILDPTLDLALVPWRVGFCVKNDASIMPGELHHFRIEIGIEPVGVLHRGLQIINHKGLRDTTEMPADILYGADEILRGLPEDRFRIALAGVGKCHAKDVGSALLFPLDDPCP
ncbi:MAG: hypothetical protein ABIJ52_07960 [Pseudomonadota bacterium]